MEDTERRVLADVGKDSDVGTARRSTGGDDEGAGTARRNMGGDKGAAERARRCRTTDGTRRVRRTADKDRPPELTAASITTSAQ